MSRWTGRLGAFLVLALVLQPLFFVIFRLMVFGAVQRDYYERFLLLVVGQPFGEMPDSPFGYRILTMIAAAPFYYLPAITVNDLPAALSLAEVKAAAAIACLSYLCAIASAVMAYAIAVDKAGLSRVEGIAAGAVLFVLSWHLQIVGIDTAAVLLITLGIYLVDRRLAFAALVILSVGFNEKVAFFFVMWLTIRCVLVAEDRQKLWPAMLASFVALAAYLAIVLTVRLPGNSYQLDVAGYPATMLTNLMAYLTVRGLMLNVLPVAVLTAGVLWAWRVLPRPFAGGLFRPVDALMIPAMLMQALVLTQLFQAGRIAMHAAPLFAVPVGAALGQWALHRLPERAAPPPLRTTAPQHVPVGL